MSGRGPAAPGLGVVVVTRNRRDSLLRTLGHLAALPEQPEIVVVDNGSSDGTAAAAREGGVRVIELGPDAGPAARTTGVRALSATVVAFADDDSWWAPGALVRAGALFAAHPRLGLIAARILVGPEGRLDPVCAEMAASPLLGATDLPGAPILGFVACGAVVRRRAYLEVGGFEPAFGFGGEEQLLALDLAVAGWQLAYVPDLIAHHWPSRGAASRSRRPATEIRNGLWSVWLRRRLRPALAATARLSATGLRERHARALLEAYVRLPWALRGRRPLPLELERAVASLDSPLV